MKGWSGKLLTSAGREVMIKSVITAVPLYLMNCFKFPLKTCRELDSLVAGFWWSGGCEERKIHWRAWERMTDSKREGGMGFRQFEAINDALLAKTAWRLLNNPDDLWTRMLKGVCFPDTPFLDAKKGGRASWIWDSLLEGRSVLMEDLFWRIGNGSEVRLWRDKWVKGVEGKLEQFVEVPEEKKEWLVSDIIQNGRWAVERLRGVVPEEKIRKIEQVSLAHVQRRDGVVWCERWKISG